MPHNQFNPELIACHALERDILLIQQTKRHAFNGFLILNFFRDEKGLGRTEMSFRGRGGDFEPRGGQQY